MALSRSAARALLTLWLLITLAACAPAPIAPLTVTLIADGETRTLVTEGQTVRDVLLETGIALDEDDRVTPPEITFLSNGLTIRVIRVETRTESEERIIPYGRETVRDATVPAGETRLLSAGVNGLEELTYAITLEDGVQVDRRLVRQVTVRPAQNEVILVGAREEVVATPISGTVAYLAAHNAWVMRTTTGNRRRLTTSGDLDGRVFSLSPDGRRLLFTRAATETDTLNTLWMMDTVTADAEPLRLRVDNVLWAAWAPDGERIAFSTGAVRDAPPGWEAANDLTVATVRASDGQLLNRRQVLAPSAGGAYGWWGTIFAWAPGGELLAYARADEVGAVGLEQGAAIPAIRFPPFRTYAAWAWTPTVAWSPDGGFFVTVAHGPSPTGETPEDSPVFDVYVVGVALGARQAVTITLSTELASEVGMWATPSFSPDGEQIVFGRARVPYTSQTSTYELYLMDRDGSERRLLFPQDPRETALDYPTLAWDPAGGRMMIVHRGDLYLLTMSGETRRVTDDGTASDVRWVGP